MPTKSKQFRYPIQFGIYNRANCSVFNLLDGGLEPKQTKALGFVLAKSPMAFNAFVGLINSELGYHLNFDYQKDKICIDCEYSTTANKRMDVLIRCYDDYNRCKWALVVEAKSITANIKPVDVVKQLKGYISSPKLNGFSNNVYPVILTKVKCLSQLRLFNQTFTSISWAEVLWILQSVLQKNSNYTQEERLIKAYINYMEKITLSKGNSNRIMLIEREVLSVPAKRTIKHIEDTYIYECPADYRTYKTCLYLACRGTNGEITKLYRIDQIVEMELDNHSIDSSNLDGPVKERLKKYTKAAGASGRKRVFILDPDKSIILPRPVKQAVNNVNISYHDLCDFFQIPQTVILPHKP